MYKEKDIYYNKRNIDIDLENTLPHFKHTEAAMPV